MKKLLHYSLFLCCFCLCFIPDANTKQKTEALFSTNPFPNSHMLRKGYPIASKRTQKDNKNYCKNKDKTY